jgi:Mg-chelatase subunit ChlD
MLVGKKLVVSWMNGTGMRHTGAAALVCAFVLLTATSAPGQVPKAKAAPAQAGAGQPDPAPGGQRMTAGPTYTSADGKSSDGKSDPKFPNVDVVFTLTGPDGQPIQAKPGDLKLFSQGTELGTATSIHTFEQTGHGLTAILALDASGSMRGAPINAIHATIAKFVGQARTQDRVEVVTFADETKYDVPFGASQDALKQELETVQPRGKFTHLYDGLLDAMDQFKGNQPKRRQIVVISDGHDEGSTHTLADVVVKANKLSVVIDGIGLTRDHGEFLTSLQQMANDTGGTYQRAMTAEDLDHDIDAGIQANRQTPVASFKTQHLAADNALHSTQLRWKPGNLTATAFVSTPQRNWWQNPLVWVLGGCFLAGMVLLAISWFGSKSGAKGQAAGVAPAAPLPPPPPVPAGFAPAPPLVAPRQTPTTFESKSGPGGRTPTAPETLPAPGAFAPRAGKPAVTSIESQFPMAGTAQVEIGAGEAAGKLGAGKDILGKERGKTRLAAFFDAPDGGPYALIRVQNGDMAGTTIPMTATTFSLGALAGNSLILPGDATISGQHLKFFWEGSILKVEDLNSTNGTFLNTMRLSPGRQLLRPGDEVRIGQTVLVLDRV